MISNRVLVICLLLSVFTINSLYAQEATVGTKLFDDRVLDGYTILSSHHSKTTYLIDPCGFEVHKWESDYFPGNTVRLMPDGRLLRAARVDDINFIAGGAGGRIEILNWDSSISWEFNYVSEGYRHHHDVLEIPNGNILLMAWDGHSKEDAINQGRNPDYLGTANEDVWGEHILEIKPLPDNQFEIVWEWYLWDHLIQDFDDTKLNYSVVSDHPEKVNINYVAEDPNDPDWIHANGFSYNPDLDQIILSAHRFDEIWVIDHSTTTEEARTGAGGNSGKGGDLLYRYGNPMTYNMGDEDDQKLFGQHNPNWTGRGYGIMVFNNGSGRIPEFSSIDFITLPTQNGEYFLDQDGIYGPDNLTRSYSSDIIEGFEYSSFLSGAIELSNENILICSGANGNLLEITKVGEPVWNYINPITSNGIVDQGFDFEASPSVRNLVFRAYKYAVDYEAFQGQTLEPTERIEGLPFERYPCQEIITNVENRISMQPIIYPNPVSKNGFVTIQQRPGSPIDVAIFNLQGSLINKSKALNLNGQYNVDLGSIKAGIYLFKVGIGDEVYTQKVQILDNSY